MKGKRDEEKRGINEEYKEEREDEDKGGGMRKIKGKE